MKGAASTIFLVVFGFLMLIVMISLSAADVRDMPKTQLVIAQLPQTAGMLLAIAGGIGLMLSAIQRPNNLGAAAGFSLALLGGVLIATPNWGAALAMAAIVAARVIGQNRSNLPPSSPKPPSLEEPPV